MTSTQYDRDFAASGATKRPGRIDLKLFQNIDDVGDGYPGMQKAIRNWVRHLLSDGILDIDFDMNDYKISDVSEIDGGGDAVIFSDDIDLNGALDVLNTLDVDGDVTFNSALDMTSGNINNVNNLDVNGNIDAEGDLDVNGTSNLDNTDIDGTLNVSGTVDFSSNLDMNGNNIMNSSFDGLDLSGLDQTEITELENINSVTITNTQWGYLGNMNQDVNSGSAVSFAGITLTNSLNTNGNVINDNGGDDVVEIADGLKVSGSTKTAGGFYTGVTDPTNTNRLNYDGNLYANKVYGAVYN